MTDSERRFLTFWFGKRPEEPGYEKASFAEEGGESAYFLLKEAICKQAKKEWDNSLKSETASSLDDV